MSRLIIDLFSETLEMYTNIHVFLPSSKMEDIKKGEKLKSITVLHGLSDNDSIWGRRTEIERYADKYGYALIMPAVQRSFYTDMTYGLNYFKYVKEELFSYTRSVLPISDKWEDSYVMGVSMGGYGAFKMAFSIPYLFSKAFSISGALDIKYIIKKNEISDKEAIAIFGSKDDIKDKDDIFNLFLNNYKDEKFPSIKFVCGLDDFLYDVNQRFYKLLKDNDFSFEYEEGKGNHDWDYFSKMVPKAMRFFRKKI